MSLNWNITGCRDHEELLQTVKDEWGKEVTKPDGMTEAIIWQSMVTGLGKSWSLDAEFAPELYARLALIERLNGGPLAFKAGHEPWHVTPEDVERRIGLTCNVSPVSRSAFIKNVVGNDLDRDKVRYEKAVNKKPDWIYG